MCFGCSKEPSHREGSFEYPQHMFGWEIKYKKKSNRHSNLEACQMIANSILIIVPFILQKMQLHILSDSFTITKISILCKLFQFA